MYIAFSSPALKEGVYHVYLGGDIEGEELNGLYTTITSYTPGTLMQHGEGTAQRRAGGFGQPPEMSGMPDRPQDMTSYQQALGRIDLNELLKDADLNALLKKLDLNQLLAAYNITELLTDEQLSEHFGDLNLSALQTPRGGFGGGFGGGRGMGGPRSLESSSDTATDSFILKKDSTGFTNVKSAQ